MLRELTKIFKAIFVKRLSEKQEIVCVEKR